MEASQPTHGIDYSPSSTPSRRRYLPKRRKVGGDEDVHSQDVGELDIDYTMNNDDDLNGGSISQSFVYDPLSPSDEPSHAPMLSLSLISSYTGNVNESVVISEWCPSMDLVAVVCRTMAPIITTDTDTSSNNSDNNSSSSTSVEDEYAAAAAAYGDYVDPFASDNDDDEAVNNTNTTGSNSSRAPLVDNGVGINDDDHIYTLYIRRLNGDIVHKTHITELGGKHGGKEGLNGLGFFGKHACGNEEETKGRIYIPESDLDVAATSRTNTSTSISNNNTVEMSLSHDQLVSANNTAHPNICIPITPVTSIKSSMGTGANNTYTKGRSVINNSYTPVNNGASASVDVGVDVGNDANVNAADVKHSPSLLFQHPLVTSLAWRHDGMVLAVGLRSGAVALIDVDATRTKTQDGVPSEGSNSSTEYDGLISWYPAVDGPVLGLSWQTMKLDKNDVNTNTLLSSIVCPLAPLPPCEPLISACYTNNPTVIPMNRPPLLTGDVAPNPYHYSLCDPMDMSVLCVAGSVTQVTYLNNNRNDSGNNVAADNAQSVEDEEYAAAAAAYGDYVDPFASDSDDDEVIDSNNNTDEDDFKSTNASKTCVEIRLFSHGWRSIGKISIPQAMITFENTTISGQNSTIVSNVLSDICNKDVMVYKIQLVLSEDFNNLQVLLSHVLSSSSSSSSSVISNDANATVSPLNSASLLAHESTLLPLPANHNANNNTLKSSLLNNTNLCTYIRYSLHSQPRMPLVHCSTIAVSAIEKCIFNLATNLQVIHSRWYSGHFGIIRKLNQMKFRLEDYYKGCPVDINNGDAEVVNDGMNNSNAGQGSNDISDARFNFLDKSAEASFIEQEPDVSVDMFGLFNNSNVSEMNNSQLSTSTYDQDENNSSRMIDADDVDGHVDKVTRTNTLSNRSHMNTTTTSSTFNTTTNNTDMDTSRRPATPPAPSTCICGKQSCIDKKKDPWFLVRRELTSALLHGINHPALKTYFEEDLQAKTAQKLTDSVLMLLNECVGVLIGHLLPACDVLLWYIDRLSTVISLNNNTSSSSVGNNNINTCSSNTPMNDQNMAMLIQFKVTSQHLISQVHQILAIFQRSISLYNSFLCWLRGHSLKFQASQEPEPATFLLESEYLLSRVDHSNIRDFISCYLDNDGGIIGGLFSTSNHGLGCLSDCVLDFGIVHHFIDMKLKTIAYGRGGVSNESDANCHSNNIVRLLYRIIDDDDTTPNNNAINDANIHNHLSRDDCRLIDILKHRFNNDVNNLSSLLYIHQRKTQLSPSLRQYLGLNASFNTGEITNLTKPKSITMLLTSVVDIVKKFTISSEAHYSDYLYQENLYSLLSQLDTLHQCSSNTITSSGSSVMKIDGLHELMLNSLLSSITTNNNHNNNVSTQRMIHLYPQMLASNTSLHHKYLLPSSIYRINNTTLSSNVYLSKTSDAECTCTLEDDKETADNYIYDLYNNSGGSHNTFLPTVPPVLAYDKFDISSIVNNYATLVIDTMINTDNNISIVTSHDIVKSSAQICEVIDDEVNPDDIEPKGVISDSDNDDDEDDEESDSDLVSDSLSTTAIPRRFKPVLSLNSASISMVLTSPSTIAVTVNSENIAHAIRTNTIDTSHSSCTTDNSGVGYVEVGHHVCCINIDFSPYSSTLQTNSNKHTSTVDADHTATTTDANMKSICEDDIVSMNDDADVDVNADTYLSTTTTTNGTCIILSMNYINNSKIAVLIRWCGCQLHCNATCDDHYYTETKIVDLVEYPMSAWNVAFIPSIHYTLYNELVNYSMNINNKTSIATTDVDKVSQSLKHILTNNDTLMLLSSWFAQNVYINLTKAVTFIRNDLNNDIIVNDRIGTYSNPTLSAIDMFVKYTYAMKSMPVGYSISKVGCTITNQLFTIMNSPINDVPARICNGYSIMTHQNSSNNSSSNNNNNTSNIKNSNNYLSSLCLSIGRNRKVGLMYTSYISYYSPQQQQLYFISTPSNQHIYNYYKTKYSQSQVVIHNNDNQTVNMLVGVEGCGNDIATDVYKPSYVSIVIDLQD